MAYVFLAVFLVATVGLTWYTGDFFASNSASLDRMFMFFPWVFLFLIPAVGMRLWAEERRSGTWELLFTFPITVWQAVAGKFLAGWAFVTLAVVLTFPLAITVSYLGDPDWGPILSGYLGSILMAGAFLSIAAVMSSLTKNQVISFVLSVLVCLVLVLLGWSQFNDLLLAVFPVTVVDAIANFSFIPNFDAMVKGLITFQEIFYFFSVIIFSLALNILALER